MKVVGFSFVRNAIKLDYPVVEALSSILPLCDEIVVAVGDSDDNTREVVEGISPKIRIIDTVWDDSLREGGKVLAIETDKAKAAISADADWLIYIQADECMHEKDVVKVRTAMEQWNKDTGVDGLLFNYKHFYGSYSLLGDSRTWYRKEIRIIKNDPDIHSWKDAQGFRKGSKKLNVMQIDAEVYHYGWVRHPKYMMAKAREANKLWHDDKWIEDRFKADQDFDYSQIDSLKKFEGTHPKVMQERISKMNWSFDKDPSEKSFGLKNRFLYWVEQVFGYRIGEHKNYTLVP